MPLYQNARALMRANLLEIAAGRRVKPVAIGTLSEAQLEAINKARRDRRNHRGEPAPFPPMDAEVIFFGQHMYDSRVTEDGYTIEDVLDQVHSAMDTAARWIPTNRGTVLQNHTVRVDRSGKHIRDKAVLECERKHPRAELYSVVPDGDGKKRKEGQ